MSRRLSASLCGLIASGKFRNWFRQQQERVAFYGAQEPASEERESAALRARLGQGQG
jgi:hypothetical protein